ncbi:MAG: signal peptide peptidase SppA [Chloroflexi bacterium]|nr:signal peptide peptidase SppA [Chloroflexota bacterium]
MTSMQTQKPSSRTAWALGGVAVGCTLPIFVCLCLTLTSVVGFSSLFNTDVTSTTTLSTVSSTYISGPRSGPAVAVIDISGQITSGEDDASAFGSTSSAASGPVIRAIRAAASDPNVMAILLRVDSPGGSVIGSDEMYHALRKSGKPIVVQMKSMAASGGYYVSMAADYIVAHPDTLTGSIGVISEFTNYEGLYDKLGLKSRIIKSGENKDFGSPTVPFTADDEKLWQKVIDEAYDNFVQIIAERRGLPLDEVRKLADGRVYTGRQAAALKLIDSLGYYEDALSEAAKRGGIEGEPRVLLFQRRNTWTQLLSQSMAQAMLQALGLPVQMAQTGVSLQYR